VKVYNGYSEVMFTPDRLRRVVAEIALHLPRLRAEYGFDTIVVSGKSGAAVGFALSMVTDINVVFVRKGETTHGDMIEGPSGHEFTRYAFLDDFVASGSTRDRVQAELANYADTRGAPVPKRVLTIEYQTGLATSGFKGNRNGGSFCVANPQYLEPANVSVYKEAA
jgi:hypothetical protein